MSVRPLRPDTDRCLGEPLPHQLANQARAPLQAPGLTVPGFDVHLLKDRMLCGISVPFGTLSPTRRQVTHVLLTRLPLSFPLAGKTAFDLHVLGTPPALILSQDQTLMLNSLALLSGSLACAHGFPGNRTQLFNASYCDWPCVVSIRFLLSWFVASRLRTD